MQVCLHGLKNGHDVGPPLSMYRRQQPWGVHLALLCVVTQVQWPEWTSSWTRFGNPAVVVVIGLRVSLVARGVWTPGWQLALEGGIFLVCARASGSAVSRCHGREDGVVFTELRVVAVA
jgi:hypothetical protein